mgnify:CR=1 FL=1
MVSVDLETLTVSPVLNDVTVKIPVTVHLDSFTVNPELNYPDEVLALQRLWWKLDHELIEALPEGCTLTYDIFRENIDQQQIVYDGVTYLGIQKIKSWMQIFKPSKSNLTGVSVLSRGIEGTPGDLKFQIYSLIGSEPNIKLAEVVVDPSDWETDELVFGAFDLELDTSTYYCFVLTVDTPDDSNYYKLWVTSTNNYSKGKSRYKNSHNNWSDYSGDLYFKTYYPINIYTDQEAPIDLSNIHYSNIKVRGKLNTDDSSYTPKIDKIMVTKEKLYD